VEVICGTVQGVNDSPYDRGWAVGHMHEGLRGTTDLEVKLWDYKDPIDYPKKNFGGTELIVVYGGAIRLLLEKDDQARTVVVPTGSWVLLEPNITRVVEIVEIPAYGITVRWPSGASLNRVGAS